MPGWWQWYYWLDPVSHTLYSLVVSQLGGMPYTPPLPIEAMHMDSCLQTQMTHCCVQQSIPNATSRTSRPANASVLPSQQFTRQMLLSMHELAGKGKTDFW